MCVCVGGWVGGWAGGRVGGWVGACVGVCVWGAGYTAYALTFSYGETASCNELRLGFN